MMILQKCEGPACPRCGCQDVEIRVQPKSQPQANPDLVAKFGVANWFASGRAKCGYCGMGFSFRELPEEEGARGREGEGAKEADQKHSPTLPLSESPPHSFPVRQCPRCGGNNLKVTSTRKPLRHHKCLDCAAAGKVATFKSIEQPAV